MVVEFNHFPEISKKLENALSKVVRETAMDIQARAASAAPVAAENGSFLRDSIYVTGAGMSSTYGRGVRKAGSLKANKHGVISGKRIQRYIARKDRQAKQEAMLFNELPPPPDKTSAYVAVGATYGMYVNYGTRRMPARPFWEPAIEAARPGFDAALSAIESQLGGTP